MRVLLVIPVSDNKVFRSIISNLVVLGHNVFEAENGKEVAEFVRGEQMVDLVIISLAVSPYRNQEPVRLVKSRWPNVKIIVLFEGGYKGHRRVVKADGADLLLSQSSACDKWLLKEAINLFFPPKP